jgi:hypothetical protein
MKRTLLLAAIILSAALGLSATQAQAEAVHDNGAIGFHNSEAPLGVRWWFSSQKMALDLGLGFSSTPGSLDSDESVMGFALDVGLPIVLKSWDRLHLIVRPGILYQSQEFQFTDPGPPVSIDTETATQFSVTGELEAEVFLIDNFSVSASHGIAFSSFDPGFPGSDSSTSFGTIDGNFTEVGFHLYCFGGGQ